MSRLVGRAEAKDTCSFKGVINRIPMLQDRNTNAISHIDKYELLNLTTMSVVGVLLTSNPE